MKTKIEIEVDNIKVDDRYYSFEYKVWVDGKMKIEDVYDSDHEWSDDKKGFKDHLKNGGAVHTVLDKISIKNLSK